MLFFLSKKYCSGLITTIRNRGMGAGVRRKKAGADTTAENIDCVR